MRLVKAFNQSISIKLSVITGFCLIVFLVVVLSVVGWSSRSIGEDALSVTEDEVEVLVNEYYSNYMAAISHVVEEEMTSVDDEIHILSGIVQSYFDNYDDMEDLVATLRQNPYFRDDLKNYEQYHQNDSDEPTTVLVVESLLDDNGEISRKAEQLIEDTLFLDLVLPQFYESGTEKVQVFFQGGKDNEIFRIAPWVDLGKDLQEVYPEIFSLPIWETFNPGLIEQWEEEAERLITNGESLNGLLKMSPPVQDGLTGEFIVGVTQPIINQKTYEVIGCITYDLPITNITEMIEGIELSESGFAFITHSDGDVFGVNELGLETLGLHTDAESMVDSEQGFTTLDRTFEDSVYESVRGIEVVDSNKPEIQFIEIDGYKYLLVSKQLSGYQTWSAKEGFYQDYWQVGFVVPVDEVYDIHTDIEVNIRDTMRTVIMVSVLIMVVITVIIVYLIYRFNRSITRRLEKLAMAAGEAEHSNYDFEMAVESEDEVGVLTSAFSRMLAQIKSSFEELESKNQQLYEEINARQQKDQTIEYLENFDVLTKLPNKKYLVDALENIGKDVKVATLVVCGVDGLRAINEAYGWAFGDKLIHRIGRRLDGLVVGIGTLYRLSGDEFAVLTTDVYANDVVDLVVEITAEMGKYFYIDETEILMGISSGISSYPLDADEPVKLLKYAIKAMTYAKEHNKGRYVYYSSEHKSIAKDRMVTLTELRNALSNREFELHYQPVISSKDESVTGMEALIRWHNEKLGQVYPDVFIPIAEETGLIVEIGHWVLTKALQDTKALHESGYPELMIAVNVSVVQFQQSDFAAVLAEVIEDVGIDPKKVTVEVTEGSFINDIDKMSVVLERIKALGVSISVDDFGTGYSSLSLLKDLPLSILKIDRSFICEMGEAKGKTLVDAIIGLGDNLGLSMIAEGVEEEEQAIYLRDKGCQEIQGYYYSRPLDYVKFIQYLAEK